MKRDRFNFVDTSLRIVIAAQCAVIVWVFVALLKNAF